MKQFFLLLLAAAASGTSLGYVLADREHVRLDDRFGQFSKYGDLHPHDLRQYFDQLQQQGLPQAEVVGGNRHDFGSMLQYASSDHEFEIKNSGDHVLELDVRSTTCTCTVGDVGKAKLAPGESTTVRLEWTVKTVSHQFEQSATIGTNDPANAEIRLVVTGRVIRRLMMAPDDAWNIGERSGGSTIEATATIYNRYETDLVLESARWSDELIRQYVNVEVTVRPVDPDRDAEHADARQAIDVRLTIAPGLNQGPVNYNCQLRFRAEDPKRLPADTPELVVLANLSGRIVGDISVKGGGRVSGRQGGGVVVSMPPMEVGTGVSERAIVFLRGPHRNDCQLSIGDIDPADVLEATLGEPTIREELVFYPITIRVRADAPVGERSGTSAEDFGTITIQADHSEVPPLLVRVKYLVHLPKL